MQNPENSILFKKYKQSQNDRKMFRRNFERHLSDIKLPHHYTGFTNRILVQQIDFKTTNFFIPVYVILKIKSIQEIDIQKLTGNICCVIIIQVKIQNLPEQIIHLLETGMCIQLNRSELVQLKQTQENISVVRTDKMLSFMLRKTVSGSIVEETLWSPFEIIRILFSITFSSINKNGEEIEYAYLQNKAKQIHTCSQRVQHIVQQLGRTFLPKAAVQANKISYKPEIYFDSFKKYNISFNCMRNGAFIPISYSLGCVYSVYDLAERKLQSYHTNLDSYSEIIRNYQSEPKDFRKSKSKFQKAKKNLDESKIKPPLNLSQLSLDHKTSSAIIGSYLQDMYNKIEDVKKEKGLPKPKYYQFTHFVIPLYKYPGNSLATIFIPIFLLALLSLAIFYQDNELSSRIGSIATMVLGYIALIPSVKDQLPPSSKVTIIESVIYLSTLCCLLSLIQSFMVNEVADYVFSWKENKLFLLCLTIHASIFVFILSLLAIHKLVWEKSYNYDSQVKSPDPDKEKDAWINLYCDEQFFRVNDKIYKMRQRSTAELVKKYEPKYKSEAEEAKPAAEEDSGLLQTFMEREKPKDTLQEIETIAANFKREQTLTEEQGSNLKSQFQAQTARSMVTSTVGYLPVFAKGEQIVSKKNCLPLISINDSQKPKLRHHISLEYLDELIKKGKHVAISMKKQASKMSIKSKILRKNKND